MPSLLHRLLGSVTAIRPDETMSAALMFAYSFLAMTSYNILKPITRSQFITALGADNLPYVLFLAGILIGVVMHYYTSAIRRLPPQHVVPITQAVIVGLLVVFWALLRTGAAWVTVAFYFFGLILGILLISQFWTLANDIFDARQAKRLFGFIGGGASLGGALGAAMTAAIVEEVGSGQLVLVSAVALAGCAGIVLLLLRRHRVGDQAGFDASEQGVGGGEAISLLSESRGLQVLALTVGCAAAGRRRRRAATEHGGRGPARRRRQRQHRGVPRPDHRLSVAHRVRRADRARQPHPSVSRHRRRPAPVAHRVQRQRRAHPPDRRAVGGRGGPGAGIDAALHAGQDDA